MITHLSLDLDGTLVDWNPLPATSLFIARVMRSLTKEIGFAHAARAFWSLNQVLTAKKVPDSQTHYTNSERATQAFAHAIGSDTQQASRLIEETLTKVFPTLEKHFFPVPGAKEFVSWAKEKYSMILSTNPVWPKEIIEMRIKWAGLDPSLFQFITDSNSMHFCKPEEKYFTEILKLRSLDPSQVLHVGNEIEMDLPASKSGIRVFILDQNAGLKKITSSHPSQAMAWKGSFHELKNLLMEQKL